MPNYAAQTEVSSDRSMAEIRRTLQRYGAEQLMWGEAPTHAAVEFIMRGRRVRILVPMPDPKSREFTHTDTGRARVQTQRIATYEQAIRQRWRALNLVIKAKLEAVDAGISAFDTEFLGHIVLPNGQTVDDAIGTDISHAYETNTMPALLPGLRAIEGG